jgi:hypothetical protein
MSDSQPGNPAAKVYHGVVRGQMIVLDEPIDLPDGTLVTIEIVSLPNAISEEDRAILEHVYRERGCGVERDC